MPAMSCARRSRCTRPSSSWRCGTEPTRSELRAAIASAIEEADRLSQLAEDLLVLARADKGRLSIELEPVEVRELFAAVRSRSAVPSGRPAGRWSSMIRTAWSSRRTALRVEQAMANLVENGLHHGNGADPPLGPRNGGGHRAPRKRRRSRLPSRLLPHAFERFRRSDAARTGDGVGLGLAIVDAIAQAHGGRAGARNSPQGGADVWIALDRAT